MKKGQKRENKMPSISEIREHRAIWKKEYYSIPENKAKKDKKDAEYREKNREAINEKNRQRYADNKVKEQMRQQRRRFVLKLEVLSHYSQCGDAVCACCGEDEIEFLSIDHINGGGIKQRKKLGRSGWSFYLWLKSNNFPDGFRVLCHNCNQSYGQFGYCPHEVKS